MESASDLQKRDVKQLLGGPVDADYLRRWAKVLEVEPLLEEALE